MRSGQRICDFCSLCFFVFILFVFHLHLCYRYLFIYLFIYLLLLLLLLLFLNFNMFRMFLILIIHIVDDIGILARVRKLDNLCPILLYKLFHVPASVPRLV